VFDYMREAGEQPKAVVMVTDGYCSDFGEAPECPVLWVLTQQNRGFVPPFGELACVLND
jgi:predicted metal-dependent peptidase